jgi:hypothetical protein
LGYLKKNMGREKWGRGKMKMQKEERNKGRKE